MTKKREEISNEYKWDLTSIYKSIKDWNKDYDYVLNELPQLTKYKSNLMDSSDNLLQFLKLSDNIDRRLEKLFVYAHMNNDSDTTNTFYQELYGKAVELNTKVASSVSFVNPLLLSYDYSVIDKYISEKSELKDYEIILKEIFRYKDHILSDKEEKILSTLSGVFSNAENTYNYLVDSDLKFGNIHDENGKEVELTDTNFMVYIRSNNRKTREEAFNKLYNTYGGFKNTISSTLSGNIDAISKVAKLKNFNSSIEESLFSDEVDVNVYDKLIDTVHDNLDVLYDYYDIKKQVLGIDDMHLYDVYAKLVDSYNKEYSFLEAKELVIHATSILGSEYTNNINKAFDEHWIDIYPNVGKRGGAYSGGSYDTNPFVLLNFKGLLNDVSTLSHELGHSMHSYLTRTNNNYQTGDYKIFVAEVASTVNELLLAYYMLEHSKDAKERLAILNELLDLYKSTIYRQVMFAEFEKNIYEKAEHGEILTHELLCNIYYDLNKLYFGDSVCVDELIKYEWMRVPHFYYNFYVYKYATGLSCASHIVSNILNHKDGAVDNYIKFLSSGSKKPPMELLKDTGCDLNSSEVVVSAIKMFDSLLDDFIKTYNDVKEGSLNGQKRLLRGAWRK